MCDKLNEAWEREWDRLDSMGGNTMADCTEGADTVADRDDVSDTETNNES